MDKSQRKIAYDKMILKLKEHPELRDSISSQNIDKKDIAEPENFVLFFEHWTYLRKTKKKAESEKEIQKLTDEIGEIQQFMLMAQYGDRNIGRFNQIGDEM